MRKQSRAVLMLLILLASTIVIPMPTTAEERKGRMGPTSQPWAQYGRDPGHSRVLPEHGDLVCQPSKHLLSIGLPSIQALEQMDTALLLQTCLHLLLRRKGPKKDVVKIIYSQSNLH